MQNVHNGSENSCILALSHSNASVCAQAQCNVCKAESNFVLHTACLHDSLARHLMDECDILQIQLQFWVLQATATLP